MGWASAGPDIFDPVTRALQAHVIDHTTRQTIASSLIAALQAGDWDTEDESLNEFRGDPAIVAAFAEHGITLDDDEDEPIDTRNDHLVGRNAAGVTITLPPARAMPDEEAIRLAAWLVMMAGDFDAQRFDLIFKAVRNS